LLDVAQTPRAPEFLDAALKSLGVERQALERLGLVRRQDNEYVM
jgi:hypothetical protein